MADQGKWFKLWCSADDDPDLSELSLEDFGRWCKLGMYIKKHGTNGTATFKRSTRILQEKFRVSTPEEVISVLRRFPNCNAREEHNSTVAGETVLIVSLYNWHKYQGDMSSDRVREFRQMKRSKKRGEEKRQDKKRKEPSPPSPSSSYSDSWLQEKWPSVRKFVALYNQHGPAEWPSVEMVSSEREKRIREYLTKFPDENFWLTVFQQARKSAFCRNYQNGGMDWLLQRGKNDSIENCLKVYEGKYADATNQRAR